MACPFPARGACATLVRMPEFDDGLTETALPSTGPSTSSTTGSDTVVETDVLVVGSGPAGASAALFLSSLGIGNIMITKYRWTANTPRAHITNQRTMEIFRDLGIEDQVLADATPHELVGDTVFCTTIAGEEIGRILTWETHPAREGDARLASPSLTVDIPQTYLEPILVKNATQRGTQSRFSTEYLSHTQDADGVSTRVLDRVTGTEYTIRSKYLIGGDGARSQVAADIGLPMEGAMDIAGSMNITFKADLTHLVGHRPSVLYWVLQPGSNVGGIGAGLVRMVRPWNEWLIVWGYDIAGEPPQLDDDAAAEIVRQLVGVDDLDVEITGYSLWGNNQMYATHLQSGRVFCAGDAVHRHPPSNGLGSNTSVQDSYNLAWKIAAVLGGQAAPSLLDTYSTERAPVAEQIVLRANKSGGEFRFMEVLGVLDAETPEAMQAAIDERKANTPAGAAKRAALVEAMDLKHYEFNAHGVDMGQFYESAAIVPTVLPSLWTSATPSSTTSSPPSRARGSRTSGWPTSTATSARPTTSPRTGSSRWSPASRARHGPTPPRRWPRSSACRSKRWSSGRAGRSSTPTTTGPRCAASRSRARSWSARTRTWRGGRRRSPTTRHGRWATR
ncbi:2,4-dichlorophenol 6-monooxygenase [Promicromonospora sp. AC04]|nr:2,4-dichlorophenol 6-monooxygenase [Promicromonospora sp. AC04]